ncbi:MAG: DUF2157 domain-containing protein [Breznakibacter sp.]
MKKIEREDIQIFSRLGDLTEKGIDRALHQNVYNDKDAWRKFFQLFVLTLGVGFAVSGIVFFFAYNWADLHKFVKMGLTEGLVIATTLMVLLPKLNDNTRNIILTGASVLVGVLFAVFGQIYQTGANAYDFFLAWTIFVTLWVLISNFAPLWMLYLVLTNTTFLLYSQQVAADWSYVFICASLFIINVAVLICAIYFGKKKIPSWFINTLALSSAGYATIGIVIGIFDKPQTLFFLLIPATAMAFALGIWHGLKVKSGFYLSIIPLSLIIIVSALLIKISDGEMMFLLVSLFIVGSVTFTIKNLIDIQKKWNNEK